MEQSFIEKHKKGILFFVYCIVFNLLLLPVYLIMIEFSQRQPDAGAKEIMNAILLVAVPYFLLPTIVIFTVIFITKKIMKRFRAY
ncbi:MAG: hypothetical protein ACI35O_13225 [Bacillaceae bacterium]